MVFVSGAWELGGQGRDEVIQCERGELIERFVTEFVHKLAEKRAVGPAWVRM